MNLLWFFGPALTAAVISYLLAPLAGRLAVRLGAIDLPGPRKIHDRPIPRLGGAAVIASIAIVAAGCFWLLPSVRAMAPMRLALGVSLGLVPIVGISIRDDVAALGPGPKFLAHVAGAAVAVAFGVSLNGDVHLFGQAITIGWLAVPLSMFWLVGSTNAFNIVDGLDGLSAGLALISAFALCGVFALADQTAMAAAALVLAGGILGFLPYNVFPARQFFGDTGATAVGFCLAAFALKGGATLSAGFATLLPVFVLGLPVAETMISMARRVLRRLERHDASGVFEPDRNHMHHRLLALGVTHARAVYILYGAGLLLAGAALGSMFMTASQAALLLIALLLTGFLGVRRLGYDEFAFIRTGVALRMYDAPALNGSMFAVFVDVAIVVAAAWAAVALKSDDWLLRVQRHAVLDMIALLAPITVVVFWRLGLYRGTWRLAGIDDFVRAGCGAIVAALLGLSAEMLLDPADPAVSTFAIYALIALVLATGSRASYQILVATRRRAAALGVPTLIYGVGTRGATALRELALEGTDMRAVAFLDDDPANRGRLVNGLPIVGPIDRLERAARRFGAQVLVVAVESIPEERAVRLEEQCQRLGIALLRLQIRFDPYAAPATEGASPGAAARVAFGVAARAAARVAVARPGCASPAPPARTWPAPAPGERLGEPLLNVAFEQLAVAPPRAPLEAGQRCPACRSDALHRSHVRRVREKVRKRLTQKRLYRCDHCGWRGWSDVLETTVFLPMPAGGRPPALAAGDLRFEAGKRAS